MTNTARIYPLPEEAVRDGVYELFYRCADGDRDHADSLLLVLRQGQLLGADRWGGLISGQCKFDGTTGRHRFSVVFDGPPEGTLVTGQAAPPAAQAIELVTDIADGGTARGTVELFGQSILLELSYRGPLPLSSERSRSRANLISRRG